MVLREINIVLFFKDLLQVAWLVVHDQEHIVNWVRRFGIKLRRDYVQYVSREAVILHGCQLPHHLYFACEFFCRISILELVFKQFNCHVSVGFYMSGLQNLAEATRADLFAELIIFSEEAPLGRELLWSVGVISRIGLLILLSLVFLHLLNILRVERCMGFHDYFAICMCYFYFYNDGYITFSRIWTILIIYSICSILLN